MNRKNIISLSVIAILIFAAVSVFADDTPQEMFSAINTGDTAKVKELLDGGYNPDTYLPNGQPPVMEAAQTGNAEMVELFIKAKADVNLMADNNFGGNALTGAVWSTRDTHDSANTAKIIQMLLDAGIDINSGAVRNESDDFETAGKKYISFINPVWFVVGGSDCNADVLDFMINKGCSISWSYAVCEENGDRRDASIDNTIDAVKKSKSNKKDKKEYNRVMKILKNAEDNQKPVAVAAAPAPEAKPEAGKATAPKPQESKPQAKQPAPKQTAPKQPPKKASPAQKASQAQKLSKAKSTSAVISAQEATELLKKSVKDGNIENFYKSLVMGADINYADPENKTALIEAIMHQNHEMTEVLIYKGADVNVMTKGGNTPLSLAKDLGAEDIEQMLIKAGAKE